MKKQKTGRSLNEIAYKFISQRLTSGELVPGQKISEPWLAAMCNISRTPVREAIRRLTQEGVLYQIPSSGTYVSKLDRSQIIDAFEVRLALEGFALERTLDSLTDEDRQELSDCCSRMYASAKQLQASKKQILDGQPLVDFLSADLRFHLILLRASGNRLIIKVVTSAYQRNQFFGHYSHRRDLHHVTWAWRQHARIEKAIRLGNAEAALEGMRQHIEWSLRDALDAYDQVEDVAISRRREMVDPVDDALAQLSSSFV